MRFQLLTNTLQVMAIVTPSTCCTACDIPMDHSSKDHRYSRSDKKLPLLDRSAAKGLTPPSTVHAGPHAAKGTDFRDCRLPTCPPNPFNQSSANSDAAVVAASAVAPQTPSL